MPPKDKLPGPVQGHHFLEFEKAVHSFVLTPGQPRVQVTSTIDIAALPSPKRAVLDFNLEGLPNAERKVTCRKTSGADETRDLEEKGPPEREYTVSKQPLPAGTHQLVFDFSIPREALETRADELGSTAPLPPNAVDCLLEFSDAGHAIDRTGPNRRKHRKRSFLERYVPANPESYWHEIELRVEVDSTVPHVLYSPGAVSATGTNQWTVKAPPELSSADAARPWCSSMPFVLVAPSAYPATTPKAFARPGEPDGTLVVVSRNGTQTKSEGSALQALFHLQQHLGPFPFQKVVLYSTSWDAMEYAGGATVTLNWDGEDYGVTSDTILHELFHMYFGRYLVPADASSAWIDEALASWYAAGMPAATTPPDGYGAELGVRDEHDRTGNHAAYTTGSMLMAWIQRRLLDIDPAFTLLEALRELLSAGPGPLDQADFKAAVEQRLAGGDLDQEWNDYVL